MSMGTPTRPQPQLTEGIVRDLCKRYIEQGFSIVHWNVTAAEMVSGGGKGPRLRGWHETEFLVPPEGCGHVQVGLKTGALLTNGKAAGGNGDQSYCHKDVNPLYLVVVDIDDPGLLTAAAKILPATGLIGGRENARQNHWFYLTRGPCNSFSWSGARTDGTVGAVIEIFGVTKAGRVGHQVLVPPSIHFKTGTRYVWDTDQAPAIIDCKVLFEACLQVAALAPNHALTKGTGLPPVWKPEEQTARTKTIVGHADGSLGEPEEAGPLQAEEIEILLADTIRQVKELPGGSRRHGVNRIVFTAASRLAGGDAPDEAFEQLKLRVLEASEHMDAPAIDLRVWTRATLEAVADGRRNPRRKCRLQKFRLSAQGLADLLVEEWDSFYRFVQEHRKWLYWNGLYWETVTTETVARDMVHVLRWAQREATRCPNKAFTKAAVEWYFKLESGDAAGKAERLIRASSSGASGHLGLGISASQLNTDPWLVCVQNGYFDIRTGQLREPARDSYITKCAPYTYVPGSRSPMFDAHLDFVFGEEPDAEVAKAYYASWLGYCLTGSNQEQAILILYGNGLNGKTSSLMAVKDVTGDYGALLAKEVLIQTNTNSVNSDAVADLAGRRWGFYSESAPQEFLSEGRVKALTGGDVVRAMRKYEHAFEFHFSTKLILDTNYKPRIHGSDLGILRRLKLLPFKRTVPRSMINPNWRQDVAAKEGSGLLSWLLSEAHAYYTRGGLAPEPESVKRAHEEFKEANDHISSFLNESCNTVQNDEGGPKDGPPRTATQLTCMSSVLYKAYNEWSRNNGLFPVSSKVLLPKLLEKGLMVVKTRDGMQWTGVELRASSFVLLPTGPNKQPASP
jgi:putative DNA primase/helicase